MSVFKLGEQQQAGVRPHKRKVAVAAQAPARAARQAPRLGNQHVAKLAARQAAVKQAGEEDWEQF